jgi:hypothetical protein
MAWMREIRRALARQSQFGQAPSASSCWLQDGQALRGMTSKDRPAQATQMRAGPACR